jgi:hypothetical protein
MSRIAVQGQIRQKFSETLISISKLCVVVHTCDHSC